MMMDGVYLLLGSNLGDRHENLSKARQMIREHSGSVIEESGIYVTAPWGISDQPEFYNQVIRISTSLEAEDLLQTLLQIETDMGRERRIKWGERLIDIDILFYGNLVINTDHLVIPHPGIPDRRFTLVPLCELAPDLVHPVLNKTMTELLDKCEDDLEVKKLD